MAMGSPRCPQGWCQALGVPEDLNPGLCILVAHQLLAKTRINLHVRLLRLCRTTGQREPFWWQEAELCLEQGEGRGEQGEGGEAASRLRHAQ